MFFDKILAMKNETIELIEPTPKLTSTKCKLIAFTIRMLLQFTTYVSALVTWYIYDYFIAIAVLFLMYIIIGIIRSKMRNSAIPTKQREYQYNNKGIADWFTYMELCD